MRLFLIINNDLLKKFTEKSSREFLQLISAVWTPDLGAIQTSRTSLDEMTN